MAHEKFGISFLQPLRRKELEQFVHGMEDLGGFEVQFLLKTSRTVCTTAYADGKECNRVRQS